MLEDDVRRPGLPDQIDARRDAIHMQRNDVITRIDPLVCCIALDLALPRRDDSEVATRPAGALVVAIVSKRHAESLHAAPIADAEIWVHDSYEYRVMWRSPIDDQAWIRCVGRDADFVIDVYVAGGPSPALAASPASRD